MTIEVPIEVLIEQERKRREEEITPRTPLHIDEPPPYWPEEDREPSPPSDDEEPRGVFIIG